MKKINENTGLRDWDNNFNLIRLLAAIWVMLGHHGPIMGEEERMLGGFGMSMFGVETLFLISGYVNTKSWYRDPHYGRFVVRRFLRLWMPYAVMVLIMTFVTGPMLSNLGREGYYLSWWKTFLENLRFYIVYAQPGVFTETPIPYVTNGSLWTMPLEMLLYLIAPFLLLLCTCIEKKKSSFPFMAGLTIFLCIVTTILYGHKNDWILIIYGTEWSAGLRLMVFFLWGVLFTYPQMQRYLSLKWSAVALVCILMSQIASPTVQFTIGQIAWPYIVMSLALSPEASFPQVGRKVELSYGIYLYGFFFQQLVAQWKIQYGFGWGLLSSFLISIGMTLVVALLSYFLVEKPTAKLNHWISTNWKRMSKAHAR